MQIFRAVLTTRNFRFEAYGASPDAAVGVLRGGFGRHASQYKLQPDWWREFEDDIAFEEIKLGACLRDGEVLTSPSEQS